MYVIKSDSSRVRCAVHMRCTPMRATLRPLTPRSGRPAASLVPVRRLTSGGCTSLDEVATPQPVPGSPGAFTCTINDGWSIFGGKGCFGGVLKAQLARASAALLPPDRTLRSMNTTFLAAGGPGEVDIHATILRSGKGMSFVTAEVRQAGSLLSVAHLSFGTTRTGSFQAPSLAMPSPVPPAHHAPLDNPHTPAYFRKQLEMSWASESELLKGADEGLIRMWMRFGTPVTKDCGLLVSLLDAPPPPIWCYLKRPAFVASVSTHMQLVREAATLPGEQPWFLYESTLTHVGNGHSDIHGRLWHQDGGLAGLITQHVTDFSEGR